MRPYYWFSFSFICVFVFCTSCTPIEGSVHGEEDNSLLSKCICLIDKDIIAIDNSTFYISRDLGITWKKGPQLQKNQIVRFSYLFEDGTLFYCTDSGCFFSTDYVIVEKSSIYDIDGSFFSPESAFHCFSAYEHDGIRQVVEGKEILCWGNYNNEESINSGFIPRLWMTSDNGKTVRCVFKFGCSKLDGHIIKARHVHAVNFNELDCSLWVSTGDNPSESHWIKGTYNRFVDEIEWEMIGTGNDYKTGNLQFYDGWIIASKESQSGGIFRIRYDAAKDLSKKEMLFQTPNDCLSVYVGKSGDIVAIMTTSGGSYNPRFLYYSADQISFCEIESPIPDDLLKYGYSIFYNTWGVTSDGYLLSGIRTQGKTPLSKWDFLPSIWLSTVIHSSGHPNAFL